MVVTEGKMTGSVVVAKVVKMMGLMVAEDVVKMTDLVVVVCVVKRRVWWLFSMWGN